MATTINTNLMFSVNRYQPVKDIAEASKSGHATNVIMGISVGLESTCLPVLIMCASILGTCLALLVLLLGTATGYCYRVPIYIQKKSASLLGPVTHSNLLSVVSLNAFTTTPPFLVLPC